MRLELMIPSCIVSIIIFTILFNIGRNNYKEFSGENFDIRSMFPYEMQNNSRGKFNWYIRFVALLYALAMALFAINAFDLSFGSSMSAATAAMVINSIVMMLLFFTDMRHAYWHMFLAIIEIVLTFLTYTFVANYVFFSNVNGYPIYLGIVCLVIAVIIFLLILNPKLYHWMYLEKVKNE